MTAIGLGPADPSLVTQAALDALAAHPVRFVRTRRHPAVTVVGEATSFDDVYDRAQRFEDVYPTIVERLVDAAREHGEVLYALPGSPLVAEQTVELLRLDERVELVVIPGLSFLDLAWDRLGVDPLAAGVRVIDGHRFTTEAAGATGPLLVGQCDSTPVLSAIKLALPDEAQPGPAVTVLARLGLPDESVTTLAWEDLDRQVQPDHLTSVWIPALSAPVGAELIGVDELVRTLRERCPWDREQTHASLSRHLIEEAYEVVEAIDEVTAAGAPATSPATASASPAAAASGVSAAGPAFEHLEEELGDLLLQVVFHARLAAEEGQFGLADVARTLHDKLVRRHPHVFGTVDAADAGAVRANWEQLKAEEKGRDRTMEGVPAILPALAYAQKVGERAASVGFDWPDVTGARAKVDEELVELDEAANPAEQLEELGDLLYATVNVARHLHLDAEGALRQATAKFCRRFDALEDLAITSGRSVRQLDPAEADQLWETVKRAGAS